MLIAKKPLPAVTTSNPLVVQHNAMVNAGFTMSALEMRFFLAMLSRISREDSILPTCRITVKELCPDSTSATVYADVREMVTRMLSRILLLEILGPNGERVKQPDIQGFPLMGRALYLKKEGVVEAVFNDHLRPYLLELTSNFTKAQLSQLLKIKRPASHRIYWLLREYAAFGKRTVGVDELRHILGFTDEYADRFDHFKARVLEPARKELSQTDLPFTYELLKEGRVVSAIRFLFLPNSAQASALPSAAVEPWAQALFEVGVADKSLEVVREKLAAGEYEEGYVHYVLATVRAQVQSGKVKKEAGAVYKALTDGYLLPTYRKMNLSPAAKPNRSTKAAQPAHGFTKAGVSVAGERRRLLSGLEDARGTLAFVKSSDLYDERTRPEAITRTQATIADLEQQLARFGS
ncbi:MAG TPA: replication initiation protein [Hymenobacter sp.]|uniref:replication initiation protein n=1 Tax=Hymenobacter sp. TaxID=1898978 RepID=UPI002D7E4608|nr:replication initiation protein [Hymenobacter sp.]HET9501898.1 replication initiation protein [Hymenobacter sp.]